MLQGAERRLLCGCSILYVLNGTVCMSHDIKYCNFHSGAEFARIILERDTAWANLNTAHAERDALAEKMKALEAVVGMFADRGCFGVSSMGNSNCKIEIESGRLLERKCYSCEARDALDKIEKLT